MQSSSYSPRKKPIHKTPKTSPTKSKLLKAKSLCIKLGSFNSLLSDKNEESKSIQEIQNELQKLSQGDKLSQVQSITLGQLKKICGFVSDKGSVEKIQSLMEEEKGGEAATQDVERERGIEMEVEEVEVEKEGEGQKEKVGENVIDLQEIMGERVHFDRNEQNEGDLWERGLMQLEEPIMEPWWSMKEDDLGDRLDLF